MDVYLIYWLNIVISPRNIVPLEDQGDLKKFVFND